MTVGLKTCTRDIFERILCRSVLLINDGTVVGATRAVFRVCWHRWKNIGPARRRSLQLRFEYCLQISWIPTIVILFRFFFFCFVILVFVFCFLFFFFIAITIMRLPHYSTLRLMTTTTTTTTTATETATVHSRKKKSDNKTQLRIQWNCTWKYRS